MKECLIENSELLGLLQQQVTNEVNNARLYLAISQWCDFNAYFNLAKVYRKYHDEEMEHQDKIIEFLQDRNIIPKIGVAEIQPTEFGGIQEILQKTFERERKTTQHWKDIWLKALLVKDIIVVKKADWFVNEQIEEESKAIKFLDKYEKVGGDKCGDELFETWVGEQLG